MTATSWRPDRLAGFEQLTLGLTAPPAAGEPEGQLEATLVRAVAPRRAARAVLYVHGWNDYFFQTHLAEFFTARGVAFYAVDLRRYGRSLREGQLAGYVDDLGDYAEELNAAAAIIAREHDHLSLMGHSTGGLIASLWASGRPGLDAVILNSPWLDLQGSAMLRAVAPPLVTSMAGRNPTGVLRLPPEGGLYARTLHAELGGEWEYDRTLKTSPGPPVRAGWLKAILVGHQRVAAGLSIQCPVLVLASARTDFRRRWNEALASADIVLDVQQIAARAPRLGAHVTLVRIDGGLHDLTLSAEPVRRRTFAELGRWLDAYEGWLPG